MLHVRSYGSRVASALPVVCLPGLARTAADFHLLAAALAADPANPRLVLALDYRGHGQSAYDRNSDNYTLPVALADLSAVLTALEIAPAIFLGTSYGGLLAMMLAVWRPTAIAGVILNDIGPVIELRGLMRIKHYVGKLPVPRTLGEGAEILRWWFDAQFPKLVIGSRLPSAPGASTTADWRPTTISSSPERCKEPVWRVPRHFGTSLTRWRASR
jgi:pimeloyl-ACP methyl ester carboxylesterase